jgi:hypothetical protein
MTQKAKVNITEAEFYGNLHNHHYKFPEQHERILLRMFVTAANHLDQKEVQVTIAEKNKYREAIKKYKLSGIKVEGKKVGKPDYEYRAVVRPNILLRQANRFRKKVAGDKSLAASIKLHFVR